MQGVRKQRAAETEAALKAAAVEVFAEHGYLNTKITDITAAAGRAAGSFYNHFASKEDLLEALLTDLLAETDAVVAADAEHDPDFRNRAAVRYHVASFFAFFRAHHTVLVALQQAALVDQRFAARVAELNSADLGHLAEHVDHVRADGHEPPGPARAVAMAIAKLLWGFGFSQVVDGDTGLSDEAAVELITDLIHRGVAGRLS
jgi:AcrR family transcriptional regulator